MGLKRFGRILDGGNEHRERPTNHVRKRDKTLYHPDTPGSVYYIKRYTQQQLVVKEVVLDKVVEELVEEVIAEAAFDAVEVIRESRIVVLAEVVVSAFELVAAIVVDSPEKQYTFDRAIGPWESQIIRKICTLVNYEVTSITCKSPIFTPPRTVECPLSLENSLVRRISLNSKKVEEVKAILYRRRIQASFRLEGILSFRYVSPTKVDAVEGFHPTAELKGGHAEICRTKYQLALHCNPTDYSRFQRLELGAGCEPTESFGSSTDLFRVQSFLE
ncbi:hypothetical protein BT96DRAFT_1000451 [Gymnopus androsaceus JB14]|uniref:Uncharacterized protein n=1 Tax=Gymnopus androsaceus JB14 TaxID=1447944 RepID=A0A6A4H3P3_9AGAR|nr:hypothetical protein BT96DRAFT_1000451 [Gymnopus androsaceus JB14]